MIAPADKDQSNAPTVVSKSDDERQSDTLTNRGTSFSGLGKNITSWTSNLLATAIIVVIALTFGSQLVSSWVPRKSKPEASEFTALQSWPTLHACSLEFGDSPFQLTRETFDGADSDVISFLQIRCREELESNAPPVGQIGEHEATLIKNSANRLPIEQIAGKWRIFLGPKLGELRALPIALGIRDDCISSSKSKTKDESLQSRLVVWALAMPAENGQWTTFVAKASTLNSLLGLEKLLPDNSKRTLAMTDPAGGSIIGFSGGEFDEAIAYYQNMAKNQDWKLETDQAQTRHSWSARISPDQDSQIKGIQVQLTLDHNENLTGILMLQSSAQLTDKHDRTIESPK